MRDQGVQNYWESNFQVAHSPKDILNLGKERQVASNEYLNEELRALEETMKQLVSYTKP